jgi:hypothetical protein
MTRDDPVRPETDAVHDTTYPGMSRRRLLSTLPGLGFTQATAEFLTKDDIDGAASDEVPIVVGFYNDDPHGERKPYKKYVPSDWYNDFRHATQVQERISDDLGRLPGVVSVGVVPGELGGDNSRLIVRLQKPDLTNTLGEIPVSVEGIEVEVDYVEGFEPMSCTSDLQEWDWFDSSIYGGYEVQGDKSGVVGSVGAPAFKNGHRYLTTCQHIFSGANNEGKTLRSPGGTALGTVAADKCREDYVMVDVNSSHFIERKISHSGYRGITGHYSYDGLGHLKSKGANTQKVGRTTCQTTFAEIQTTAETIFTAPGCVPKPYSVFHKDNSSSNDQRGGDSGSISFRVSPNNNNYSWLISMMNYEDTGTDDVFGVGIYRLADFGYNF